MSLHLPGRSVATPACLFFPTVGNSALPPAQLCEREDLSALSGDKSAFEGPPSDGRATRWEIVCP